MLSLRYLFTICLLIVSLSVVAAHLPDDIEPGDGVNEIQLPLTKTSAAELIRLETKGQILSVEEKKVKGKTIFRIKVLHNNGKIKMYPLDPSTGHPPR
ncbi:MAG: hypothetical protein PSN44_01500 [Gammaproteobacteria bacterium]|nr:hypothetical protein [Gammaproteobacteria bacterium]